MHISPILPTSLQGFSGDHFPRDFCSLLHLWQYCWDLSQRSLIDDKQQARFCDRLDSKSSPLGTELRPPASIPTDTHTAWADSVNDSRNPSMEKETLNYIFLKLSRGCRALHDNIRSNSNEMACGEQKNEGLRRKENGQVGRCHLSRT